MNEEHKHNSKHEKNTGMAVVAYLLFFVPLLTEEKDDPFVKFHTRQGFLVFVTAILSSVLNMTVILMPLGMIVFFGTIILGVIGIMNAINGKKEKLPIVGQFTDKVPF